MLLRFSFPFRQEPRLLPWLTAAENLNLYGTIEDLAKYYGVPESKVRNTINRKMIEKPKRRVYYRFLSFRKIVPKKWRDNHNS